jgi:hypothetical protein
MPEQDPKRIVNELIESLNEDPEMEPGQADTTPGTEAEKPRRPRDEDSSRPDRAKRAERTEQAARD